ncbi:interleukin-20 receptor subunit beta [Echeneis naucrates]|uniref:interleukin-20 receptor subunit beta n=1 Tax=Echeneis naucrates TaxID=173247 RepID=UPI001113C674|nr:interleukin-20 receptor subunit beta-like [Echeneis naucrates]
MRPPCTVALLPALMVMMVLLHTNKAGVWTLPAPSEVSMESVNMRHTLRWRPLQAPCNTPVLYSVQFQGEFELTFLNGSWLDAHECKQIRGTHCDLTSDLGSDSDYNLHVRAQCGSEASAWSELSQPFNRRNTVLTVPEMAVTTVGDGLNVSFDKLPHMSTVRVTVWKKGEELQAVVYTMPAEQKVLNVAALQEGALYCVRAQTILTTRLRSATTENCVSFTGSGLDPPWRRPTTVAVTVIIMAGLLFAVFWSITHCRPDACRAYFNKEPLPQSLHGVTAIDVQFPTSPEEEEQIHILQSVDAK